jgi:hypothetical protein
MLAPFACRTKARKIYVSQDAERGLSGVEPSPSISRLARQALGRTPSAEVRRRAEGLLKKWSRCDEWSRLRADRLGRRLIVGHGPRASTPNARRSPNRVFYGYCIRELLRR